MEADFSFGTFSIYFLGFLSGLSDYILTRSAVYYFHHCAPRWTNDGVIDLVAVVNLWETNLCSVSSLMTIQTWPAWPRSLAIPSTFFMLISYYPNNQTEQPQKIKWTYCFKSGSREKTKVETILESFTCFFFPVLVINCWISRHTY